MAIPILHEEPRCVQIQIETGLGAVPMAREFARQAQKFAEDAGNVLKEVETLGNEVNSAIIEEGNKQKAEIAELDYENLAEKVTAQSAVIAQQSVEIEKLKALGLYVDADGDVAQYDSI